MSSVKTRKREEKKYVVTLTFERCDWEAIEAGMKAVSFLQSSRPRDRTWLIRRSAVAISEALIRQRSVVLPLTAELVSPGDVRTPDAPQNIVALFPAAKVPVA